MVSAERLVLGTAQLGIPYGINNKTGKPDYRGAVDIVQAAWESGIRIFDTAQAYGDSEKVLGMALRELGLAGKAVVITKTHPALDHTRTSDIVDSVKRSLDALGVPVLYGLMLHREDHLELLTNGLGDALSALLADGLVKHAGVSVYSPEKALACIDEDIIGLVQLPGNILDRRFEEAGFFDRAERRSKEIFLRSIFLQGLLLMAANEVPAGMDFAKPVLGRFAAVCSEMGLEPRQLCLGYIKRRFADVRVVFGAESAAQVTENVSAWNSVDLSDLAWVDRIGDVDETVISPQMWPR